MKFEQHYQISPTQPRVDILYATCVKKGVGGAKNNTINRHTKAFKTNEK